MEGVPRRGPAVTLVLDSSATLAWVFADEVTSAIRGVLEKVASDGAVVPSIWRLEIANSLTVAVRRKRIDAAFRREALADLALLNVIADEHTDTYAWTSTLALADRFHLSAYDAAYLELAQRRSLPLATLDDDLRKASHELGVTTLGV